MSNLYQSQKEIFAALTHEHNSDPTLIVGDHLSVQQRLTLYRDSMHEGFITALTETFPVCCKLLGENYFRALARRYAQQTLSTSPDLGDYGDTFSSFLKEISLPEYLCYLPDVAMLEWNWSLVFHGFEATPTDFSTLNNLDENQQSEIIFHLPKNCRLQTSPYPIHRIWEVNQDNYENETVIDLNQNSVKLFIWRQNFTVIITPLDTAEWELLNFIREEKKLTEFNEEMLSLLPEMFERQWIGGYIFD